jgi:hypothetical protein
MTDRPQRCLRVGCPNRRSDPDHRGLGLCDEHNRQVGDGTIGAGWDPTRREVPVDRAQALVADMRRPGEPIRALARRTGLPKDLLWHVIRGTFPHVKSEAWEEIREAHARLRFEWDNPVAPEWASGAPLADDPTLFRAGVQMDLLDPANGLYGPEGENP